MQKISKSVSMRGMILFSLVLLNALIVQAAFTGTENWYWALLLTLPMFIIAVRDVRQRNRKLKPSSKSRSGKGEYPKG